MRRIILLVCTIFAIAAPVLNEGGVLENLPQFEIAVGATKLRITWIVPWFLVIVVAELKKLQTVGREDRRWQHFTQKNALLLAGSIDGVACTLLGHPSANIEALGKGRLEAGLLQSVVNITRSLTGAGIDVNVHASLLVPGSARVGPKYKFYLEVINQSELDSGRSMRRHPLGAHGPAQRAFITKQSVVVPDTERASNRQIFQGRPYRSVAAFPVQIGTNGRVHAVVSVDASKPNVLTQSVLDRGLEQAIEPHLKLLGALRLAKHNGGDHGTAAVRSDESVPEVAG